ncbi:IS21 family transposase [Desulfofundulus sp. TPOSR]|jgi:transposase|uniref:IS21 family transposase n=1 Tax=Desulfofundulus sp. TPOSR TaxID=2714340 RepID=UPI0014073EDF|nr:IS21 family transposase [Desulfofundulus sp. TPOSR]NHM27717.1 IS21 family transposase [Desulfofundulus sp. TPOSR]
MAQQQYIKHLYEREECSIAEISRRVGINWRTAAKYAKKDDWNQPMQQTRRRQPVMGSFVDIVDTWLMEDMLKPRKERRTAATIYRQLREQYGFKGSGRTVRAYVSRRKKELRTGAQEKYLRLEHPPGQAQVDFGTSHVVWDGVLREIKYLTFSFPYSNAGFCVPVPSENTECLLYAMIQVFEWIGGVPPEIWFDNLSAAVVGVGKGEQRELTETFRRFMLHYRFEAKFCNSGKGNEKGHVENKVGYTRRNWLIPYPTVSSYEELTAELYRRALEDMQRSHYEKGVTIAELWEEDKKALLSLPATPFEPVRFETARVNKYGQVQCCGEVYPVPSAQVGETVLLKLWWDCVEVFSCTQERLAHLPRHYTLKTQPIDWKGYFRIFIRKPRGARHATMYRFLPEPVRQYLEACDPETYRERLKFIHTLLEEGFTIEDIARVLEEAAKYPAADSALIRHKLYRITFPDAPLEALNETYTPDSVRRYTPEINIYDRLVPQAGGKGGELRDQVVVEGAV